MATRLATQRWWRRGARPGSTASLTGRRALRAAEFDPGDDRSAGVRRRGCPPAATLRRSHSRGFSAKGSAPLLPSATVRASAGLMARRMRERKPLLRHGWTTRMWRSMSTTAGPAPRSVWRPRVAACRRCPSPPVPRAGLRRAPGTRRRPCRGAPLHALCAQGHAHRQANHPSGRGGPASASATAASVHRPRPLRERPSITPCQRRKDLDRLSLA